MRLVSSAFNYKELIPAKYTCDGPTSRKATDGQKDINPQLAISDVPKEAKSLALIMDDPDSPSGTFTHWVMWNIDPKTAEIPEHSVPAEVAQGQNDFKKPGYGGPCPGSGTHRYFFKLYALDTLLDLPTSTTKKELEKAIEGHILITAELMGLYAKVK